MKGTLATTSLASLLLLATPAFAATSTNSSSAAGHAATSGNSGLDQSAVRLVNASAQAMDHVKANSHFADLLSRAKGVFIVPHLVKGAAIVGGEGGKGVLMARHDGHWSNPAFVSIGSISIGQQAGGEAGPVVMLLMTGKALNDMTAHNNFSLNANAGLTIVNYSAKGQGGFGKGDIVVWSGESGGFVGASISGSDISSDQKTDAAFYHRSNLTTHEIVTGSVKSAAAAPLLKAVG